LQIKWGYRKKKINSLATSMEANWKVGITYLVATKENATPLFKLYILATMFTQ
jgi:hypothetical protein